MYSYQPTPVPSDNRSLQSYLAIELRRISNAFNSVNMLAALPEEPARLVNGMMVYADGANWDPGSGAGFYGYESGDWVKLSSRAGYGSIRQETPAGISIGAGWTTIPFSTAVIANPRHVEQDIADNSLHPLAEGVVILSAGLTLAHNESNQGRTLNVRIHDLDDNVTTGAVPYAVARNQPGSNIDLQVMGTINADRVGDNYVLQVQAGSGSFSSVSVEYANFMIYYLSEIGRGV